MARTLDIGVAHLSENTPQAQKGKKAPVPTLLNGGAHELLLHRLEKNKAAALQKAINEQNDLSKHELRSSLRAIAEIRFYISWEELRSLSEREFEELCALVYGTSRRITFVHGSLLWGFIALVVLSWFIGPTWFTVAMQVLAVGGFILFIGRMMYFDDHPSKCESEGVFLRSLLWGSAKYFRFRKCFKSILKNTPRDKACKEIKNGI